MRTARTRIGAVAILDEVIFTSRDVQKADARPGGYIATGGHGGIIGSMGHPGAPQFSFKTGQAAYAQLARQHDTITSERLVVQGFKASTIKAIDVKIKDTEGNLLSTAIPKVTICKHARYSARGHHGGCRSSEVDILARIEKNLRAHRWRASSPKARRPSAP
jgi:L-asparaginase